jgi:hypothetical protein
MGKNNKRKREPTPPSEEFGDSEYSEEEFSSESEGSPAPIPLRESSDDSDDSQGLAAEVWTYIQAVERSGLEGSDEPEYSSDEEDSDGGGEDEDDDNDDDDGGDGDDDGSGRGGGGGSKDDDDGGSRDSDRGGSGRGSTRGGCRCFGSDRTPGVTPQGVFRSRTVSTTVAKWFVPDCTRDSGQDLQVRAA